MFTRCPEPLRSRTLNLSGARARGLQYERQVLAHLEELFEPFLVPHPWLLHKGKYLCPDALLIRPPLIVIVEIKLSHTCGAYMQLWELYSPALRSIFKKMRFVHLEICRWFYPEEPFPGRIHMLKELSWDAFAAAPGAATAVHIWTKGRARNAEVLAKCG